MAIQLAKNALHIGKSKYFFKHLLMLAKENPKKKNSKKNSGKKYMEFSREILLSENLPAFEIR